MRRIGYGLGVALLVVAASIAVAQLLSLLSGTMATPVSLGSIWLSLSEPSLVGFQGLIEGSAGPMLWTPIQWLLSLPAWLPIGLIGILLLLFGRRQGRGGFD
jgi:hypothetical protein